MTIPNGATAESSTNGTNNAVAIGSVRSTDIIQEMQVAYLDYAMSVIVARALPDARDGLKPVHRRILYAIWHDLSLTHDKPHKKSARIVGEVLGKYHPHGDTAVYDAMVRMAQDFSLRYPLIDGQGNFGSIDGDNAAAMRYTEARLASLSDLMLTDLEKDTISWQPNFDNTLREPTVLPAAMPNLLINGSSGIAVGMATNIPPHNLGEVVDGLVYMIDHYNTVDEITVESLLQFIKGPDFPTGGIVYRFREESKDEQVDAIAQGYSVGKSRLIMQAKAHFEEMNRGRMRIVITELPYQTAKTALIERIADLVREEKLTGISDLRDESDRTGMRICIELQRGVEAKSVLADLFKYTPLQQTFGMQLLALVDGQPRMLNLKRMLQLFIQHRQEIVRRRSEWELARARERAHIVEGLLKALDMLDEVIATIRRSQTVDTARRNLMENFKFSEIQAQAILDMQLRRLAALERKKLQEEYKELRERIAYLEELLAHPEKILEVIKQELLALKEKYGDARRTQIVERSKGALTTTDLLPNQQVWVTVSADGDVRRSALASLSTTAKRQLAKHGSLAMLTANTRDYLYLFSKDGRCNRLAIHELPQDGVAKHLAELTPFTRRDTITAALAVPREGDTAGYLFLVTHGGEVKRILLSDLLGGASGETVVMNVADKEQLRWVLRTNGSQEVILVTASGQSIRFGEEEVRSMGLPAGGVGGIKLAKGDSVVYAAVVDPAGALLTITAQGFAKQSLLSEYSRQGRNGSGIVTHKPTPKTGNVVAALLVGGGVAQATLLVNFGKGNPHALALSDVPVQGRGVQGKQIVTLEAGVSVNGCKLIAGDDRASGETSAEQNVEAKPAVSPKTDGARTAKPAIRQDAALSKPNEPQPAKAAAQPGSTRTASDRLTPPPVEKKAIAERPVKVAAFGEASQETPAQKPILHKTASAGVDANNKRFVPAEPATKPPPRPAETGNGQGATQPSLFGHDAPEPSARAAKKVQTVTSVVKKNK